jgi:hypothetical protein
LELPAQSDVVFSRFIYRWFNLNSHYNMSLPDAIRDTTEHPSKNAVSAPIDRQEMADDVDRKVLLLYLTRPPSN